MKQLVVLGLISAFLGLNSVSFAEDACCDVSSKTEAAEPSEPTAQIISNEESAVVAQEGAQEKAEEKATEAASVEAE